LFTRARQLLGAITQRVPRYVLIPLLLAALGVAGYFVGSYAWLEYHYQAAVHALAREAFDEAGEHLTICLDAAPNSSRVYFLAAQAARRSGHYDAAREKLEISRDLGWPPAAIRHEEHLLAFQRGDFDPGIEQYLQACLTPTNPQRCAILEVLAQGYIKTYRLLPALDCLDAWLREQPDSIAALMRRGWVRERLDRVGDAAEDYNRVVELDPKHPAGRLRVAQLLRQQGKLTDALPVFKGLRDDAIHDFTAAIGLAQCYAGLGRTEEARALLEDLDARKPHDPTVLLERARLAMSLGQAKDARGLLRRAAQADPQSYETHYQLFLCLRRLGEEDEALKAEKQFKAIEADLKGMSELTDQLQKAPNDPDLRLRIAEIFLRRGEEKEGVLWLHSVVRLDPRSEEAHRLLAEHYERAGSASRARTHRQFVSRPGSR
jgi:tetratricopeptide (TPR) repeat protein